MEATGVVQEVNWSSYNTAGEESEVMLHLLGPYSHNNEQCSHDQNYGLSWSAEHASDSYYCSSENVNNDSNMYYWSQEDDSNNRSFMVPYAGYENYYLNLNEAYGASHTNANSTTMNYFMLEDQHTNSALRIIPNPSFEDQTEEASSEELADSALNVSLGNDQQKLQLKRKYSTFEVEDPSESSKKRTRASTNVQKYVKKMQAKRGHKNAKSIVDEDEHNAAAYVQSSCSYSSEDDLPISQDNKGGGRTNSSSKGNAAALSGKTRAGRGSATDPQSLYARKRRERINDRLKILQSLVPNGTKVDISTMLEEAVQYVKFLQLQIKMLSSDDLWMYAPIAYNGMNIGLDLKISLPQH